MTSSSRIGGALIVANIGLTLLSIGTVRAAVFVVTTTADSGAGSLRQAIIDSNSAPSSDSITFAIQGTGPHTISLASALPEITGTVVIDGYSQPGATPNSLPNGNNAVLMIELDGGDAGADAAGLVINASSSTIKGLAINGFRSSGIVVDFGQVGNTIQGNFIGPDVDGATLIGNGGQGVEILGNNNLVGGACVECGNVIAGNEEDGVFVLDNSIRNTVRRNSIFDNGPTPDPRSLGIDLFLPSRSGVNENDGCDSDGGSNFMQNFPVLSGAISDDDSITIDGSLNSVKSTTYVVEFFANTVCDRSMHGEGETFLGAANVAIGAGESCTQEFEATLPVAVADGTFITATATDPNGNTSEFSRCFRATGPQPHDLAVVKLKAARKVTLRAGGPAVTRPITVTIQNRSPHSEVIPSSTVLAAMITLGVESLPPAACGDLAAVLAAPTAFPITLLSKKQLNVTYNVTFGCANDPLQSREGAPHDDYMVVASVSHAALDGEEDSHPADDTCPRGPLPGETDPYPDGTVRDRGCGARDRITRLLGADVLIDVVVRGGE